MHVTTGTSRRTAGHGLALLTAGTACGAAGGALALRVAELARTTTPARPDQLVEAGVLALGVLVTVWLAASAALAATCLAARGAGCTWRRGEAWVHRFAPTAVRRALTVAVAVGLGAGGVGAATADDLAPDPAPGVAVAIAADGTPDLGWVVADTGAASPAPIPDTPTTPAAVTSADPSTDPAFVTMPAPVDGAPSSGTPAPRPQASDVATPAASPTGRGTTTALPSGEPAPAGAVAAAPRTVTVEVGDTLWAIAARHLAPDASDGQIAAAWPAWYAENATVVGPNPDVIRPGQVLTIPAGVAR